MMLADLLIGMDNAYIFMLLEIRRNGQFVNEPYAVRSCFGWSLYGYSASCSGDVLVHFVSLEKQLENLWRFNSEDSLENVMSVQDQKILIFWDDEISHDKGHYTLPIPWAIPGRDGRPNLPSNRYMTSYRLASLTCYLQKTGGYSWQVIWEYYSDITEVHAERVPLRN